jgi:hypothetical protein
LVEPLDLAVGSAADRAGDDVAGAEGGHHGDAWIVTQLDLRISAGQLARWSAEGDPARPRSHGSSRASTTRQRSDHGLGRPAGRTRGGELRSVVAMVTHGDFLSGGRSRTSPCAPDASRASVVATVAIGPTRSSSAYRTATTGCRQRASRRSAGQRQRVRSPERSWQSAGANPGRGDQARSTSPTSGRCDGPFGSSWPAGPRRSSPTA